MNRFADPQRQVPWLPAAMLALAFAVSWAGSWQGKFQYDDFQVIVGNPVVQSWAALSADFGHGLRPVLKLSYWFSWVSGGGDPRAFHAFNLAVHLINVLLVWQLARRLYAIGGLDPPTSATASLLAAAIFALHPLQTEAVTYVCGRSGSLMALFYLAALLAWDRYLRGRRWRHLLLVWVAFLLATGTKEPALTLPVALLLWESLLQPADGWRRRLQRHAPFWLLPLVALLLLVPQTGYADFAIASLTERPLWHNAMSQIHALVWQLRGLLLLRAPNFDPDLPVIDRVDAALCLDAAVLLALLLPAWWLARRRPWLGFCAAWVVLQFLPTNSLMPQLDLANDRQWYLPLAGVAWSAGWALAAAPPREGTWITAARPSCGPRRCNSRRRRRGSGTITALRCGWRASRPRRAKPMHGRCSWTPASHRLAKTSACRRNCQAVRARRPKCGASEKYVRYFGDRAVLGCRPCGAVGAAQRFQVTYRECFT